MRGGFCLPLGEKSPQSSINSGSFLAAIRSSISEDWSSTGFLEAAAELAGDSCDKERYRERRDKEKQKERQQVEKEKDSDEGEQAVTKCFPVGKIILNTFLDYFCEEFRENRELLES